MGSIFRTADAAGFSKIYLCGYTPAPVDDFGRTRGQLVKVSLGAENYLEWKTEKSVVGLIKKLKKEGYKIFAIEQDEKSISYNKVKISKKNSEKTAVVLGDEIEGLPKKVLEISDKILEIPMNGKKESLNVGVAFGIVAFSLNTQRKRLNFLNGKNSRKL